MDGFVMLLPEVLGRVLREGDADGTVAQLMRKWFSYLLSVSLKIWIW